jgi:hypothetical protein
LAEDRMRDRLVLEGKAGGEDDAAGNDAPDGGDTVAEIEAQARVRRDGSDLRLFGRREGGSDSLFDDFGDYHGVPRFAERGRLEEAQARLNQQQKWFDHNFG